MSHVLSPHQLSSGDLVRSRDGETGVVQRADLLTATIELSGRTVSVEQFDPQFVWLTHGSDSGLEDLEAEVEAIREELDQARDEVERLEGELSDKERELAAKLTALRWRA